MVQRFFLIGLGMLMGSGSYGCFANSGSSNSSDVPTKWNIPIVTHPTEKWNVTTSLPEGGEGSYSDISGARLPENEGFDKDIVFPEEFSDQDLNDMMPSELDPMLGQSIGE